MAKRDYTLKVRLTDAENDVLTVMAAELNTSKADLVRCAIFGPKHMRKLPGAGELVEVRRLLRNMADQLNQVTKSFHERKLAGTLTPSLIENYLKGAAQLEARFKKHARVIAEFMVGVEHRR
jgi:hypothetical protein